MDGLVLVSTGERQFRFTSVGIRTTTSESENVFTVQVLRQYGWSSIGVAPLQARFIDIQSLVTACQQLLLCCYPH